MKRTTLKAIALVALALATGFAQAQVNDRVQRFALDLFPRKTGIVLEQDHFARQTISQNAAALFGF